MAKNKSLRKYEEYDDFPEGNGTIPGDEAIAGMMGGLIGASNRQQMMAIELTKLVIQKSAEPMKEEEIFSIFKRATKVVIGHFPLKELWEKFS